MNCPQCSQTVETGAAFCGNCGQVLQNQVSLPTSPLPPAYALATPAQHAGETKALLSVLFGIFGIIGGLLMAIAGLVFGIAGLVMGTMSRSSHKRALSTVGLVISSLAILVSLGVWGYNINQSKAAKKQSTNASSTPPVLLSNLSTPCYSVGFVDKLNVDHTANSCDMKAFNNSMFDNSTEVYKVFASASQTVDINSFSSTAKQALEKDIKDSLPDFEITSQRVGAFAGSPAYIVNAYDKKNDISVVEAAVFHEVNNGENVFILVHGTAGKKVDLTNLEAQWQWK